MADETRKQDPELLAMSRIGRLLEELSDQGRGRVLMYLVHRWGPPGFSYDIAMPEKGASPCPAKASVT